MIHTWEILENKTKEIQIVDVSSLDAITRQLPDGYYSTFRTYASCTRVIGLSSHLQRLPKLDASSLRRHLTQLLEPFRPSSGQQARRGETADEARVRVILSFSGQLYVSIESLKRLQKDVYEKGVRVETTSIERSTPRVKSTAFIGQSGEERKVIARKGIFEALLVKHERILEGMTSNFFYTLIPERPSTAFVAKNEIYTAQRDILLGVTRRTVIRVARGERMGVRYASLKLDQLSAVGEAFITSSSRGVVPVVQIDDVRVGDGKVGIVTKTLMSAYDEYVLKRAEKIYQGT